MDPTTSLRDDHTTILFVLGGFEKVLGKTRATQRVDVQVVRDFIGFFSEFADAYHHRKKERYLFPMLIEAGLPTAGGPVHCMLEEHELGRMHLRALAAAVTIDSDRSDNAVDAVLIAGRAYVDLLRDHIAKENHVLFEVAAGLLGDDQIARLDAAYAAVDAETDRNALRRYGQDLVGRVTDVAG